MAATAAKHTFGPETLFAFGPKKESPSYGFKVGESPNEFIYDLVHSDFERTHHQLLRRKMLERMIRAYWELVIELPFSILALDVSPTQLEIWAVLADDDAATRSAFFQAEAKINFEFFGDGICIETHLFETSDDVQFPPNFTVLKKPDAVA